MVGGKRIIKGVDTLDGIRKHRRSLYWLHPSARIVGYLTFSPRSLCLRAKQFPPKSVPTIKCFGEKPMMNDEHLDKLRRMFADIAIERERLRSKTILGRCSKIIGRFRRAVALIKLNAIWPSENLCLLKIEPPKPHFGKSGSWTNWNASWNPAPHDDTADRMFFEIEKSETASALVQTTRANAQANAA